MPFLRQIFLDFSHGATHGAVYCLPLPNWTHQNGFPHLKQTIIGIENKEGFEDEQTEEFPCIYTYDLPW